MRRKTIALMMALTLSASLSACGEKPALQADTPDTASVEETAETTEEAEVTEEESTPEEEPTPEITPEEKVQSAIGEMPYYGDTASCKMTAEQATAYAQLIADGLAGDFSFRGGYDERFNIVSWGEPFQIYTSELRDPNEVDRFNVMLSDFANDGIPYLYVYSSNIVGNNNNPSFEIYGWGDNTSKLVVDTHSGTSTIAWETYNLYEDENDQNKIKLLFDTGYGMGESSTLYSFSEGNMEESHVLQANIDQDGLWHIIENGIETEVYSEEEYYAGHEVLVDAQELKDNHTHTPPYTCFYDMTPCTLEEMVNYLNTYASVMSDGQSVPVEIKKADIISHDGTGITTKGEVPQEKVDILEILRQYINGEQVIGMGNADSASYTEGGIVENFFFGLEDINNDSVQELVLSYKDSADAEGGYVQIHFPPTCDCLANVYGFDSTSGTYLVSEGSVCVIENLYVYDGTSFSVTSSIAGDWDASDDGGPYTITENGAEREISADEFHSIMDDWESRHTGISAKSANTHLDIENIENTFQVKIDIQSSGDWLVTGAE